MLKTDIRGGKRKEETKRRLDVVLVFVWSFCPSSLLSLFYHTEEGYTYCGSYRCAMMIVIGFYHKEN